MNKKLTIISTNSINDNSDINIVPLGKSSALNYKTDEGNEYWKRLEENSRFRPLHISELDRRLKDRDYNQGLRTYYTGNGIVTSLKPFIDKNISTSISVATQNIDEYNQYIINNALSVLDWYRTKYKTEYETAIIHMDEREINLFSTSTQVVDIMSGVQTIELVNLNSDSYTNIISLIPLKRYNIVEGVSAKVNLGIQYTNNSEIKYYSTTFTAFDYVERDGRLSLESDNWIESVNDEVQLEYINGILKALPLSNDISECIISNCTISYGYLSK